MNPFEQKPQRVSSSFMSWKTIYPKPYNKHDTDAYTKVRIILMTGAEYEANWFSHQFQRHCDNNDLRRELALTRRVEQQQQKQLACLKPTDEGQLETTITYEQLAVDLTAILAQREPDANVVRALNFALLEDFDHLYRYADLLEMEQGVRAEQLVGSYTEIMPGRPTIAHHRHPLDSVRKPCNFKKSSLLTMLDTCIITAAEQQTMNYYMNLGAFYPSDLGRRLYQEIGMVEEQHVTQYGSLIDPNCSWLENLLLHEYNECYLYWSCYEDESDPMVRAIWEKNFHMELAHLHQAVQLLQKYEHKEWQQVLPQGEFPELLKFAPQKEYVRQVLRRTVQLTADRERYRPVKSLPPTATFFKYQKAVNKSERDVPSHKVIEQYIRKNGSDYRYEERPNPVPALRNRKTDNTQLGRSAAPLSRRTGTCPPPAPRAARN